MKEFIYLIRESFQQEGFTTRDSVIYGFVYPIAFIILLGIIGHLEQTIF